MQVNHHSQENEEGVFFFFQTKQLKSF